MEKRATTVKSYRSPAGFPIAALALAITSLAVVLACSDPQRWREQVSWLSLYWPWRYVVLFGGAAMLGAFIGTCYLFASSAGWRVRLFAPLAGALAAQLGVLVLVAPAPTWRTMFAVATLLVTSVLFRIGSE